MNTFDKYKKPQDWTEKDLDWAKAALVVSKEQVDIRSRDLPKEKTNMTKDRYEKSLKGLEEWSLLFSQLEKDIDAYGSQFFD